MDSRPGGICQPGALSQSRVTASGSPHCHHAYKVQCKGWDLIGRKREVARGIGRWLRGTWVASMRFVLPSIIVKDT